MGDELPLQPDELRLDLPVPVRGLLAGLPEPFDLVVDMADIPDQADSPVAVSDNIRTAQVKSGKIFKFSRLSYYPNYLPQ
jgi:hypothetical protein